MCRSKSEGFCHLNLRDEAMIEKFIYRWKKYSLLIGIFEHYLIEPTILDKTNVSKVWAIELDNLNVELWLLV